MLGRQRARERMARRWMQNRILAQTQSASGRVLDQFQKEARPACSASDFVIRRTNSWIVLRHLSLAASPRGAFIFELPPAGFSGKRTAIHSPSNVTIRADIRAGEWGSALLNDSLERRAGGGERFIALGEGGLAAALPGLLVSTIRLCSEAGTHPWGCARPYPGILHSLSCQEFCAPGRSRAGPVPHFFA